MSVQLPTLLGAGLVLLGIFYLGFLSLKIRFPSVILYILFGIILADLLLHNEILHFSSEVGIVLLFFVLGLEFSISRLGSIAKKIWSTGILDVMLSLGVTMGICLIMQVDLFTSFLIGAVAYATSSSITAKLLDDKSRMANMETEFILALLIFEDIIAPILVAVLIGISSSGSFEPINALYLVLKILALAAGAVVLSKTIFRRFDTFMDKIEDEDFKIVLLIGIALSYGGFAVYLGLSEVLGAFLAGMILAESGKIERVEHAVNPIRDLLLPTFFIYFGTTIDFGDGVPMPVLLTIVLIWTMAAKVMTGYFGGLMYGLPKRVAFRGGLSICARGEFSVVIASIAIGTAKVFAGIYIVLAAFIGVLLFEYAPQLTNKIFGKPVVKKRNLKVPGS